MFVLLFAGHASAAEILVFVSDQSPIKNISAEDLSDIYLGETTYIDSERLSPAFYIEGNDSRADFLRQGLHVSDDAYRTHWMKRIFREGGVPPVEVTSAQAALEFVQSTPGGIGFVYADAPQAAVGTREVLRISLD